MTLDKDFENYMRRVLDSGHKSRPDADAPPADTWKQVLAKVQPQEEEKNEMSISTLAAPAASVQQSPDTRQRGVGHYLNLAATIALVLAVAVAGWLATMQLSSPGGLNDHLGFAPGTPQVASATCDVEPLSVERVMEIVKNPVPYFKNGPAGEPEYISVVLPISADLFEYSYPLDLIASADLPTREQFQSANDVANTYLGCLMNGTQGQAWNFYNPANIQKSILGEFPVFADEADVRARVEERRELPAIEGEWIWPSRSLMENVVDISTNPDRNQSRLFETHSLNFEKIIRIGVIMRDSDGEALVLTDGDGQNVIDSDPALIGTNEITVMVTLVKPRESDIWLVVPYPTLPEMGIHID